MHTLTSAAQSPTLTRHWRMTAARWMVTFLGFPAGGFLALLVTGPVDNLRAALLGGLVTGSVLGAAQAWGLRLGGPPARRWVLATGVGLMVGLAVGAALVDYETSLSALVIQGAVSGLAVGAAQALILRGTYGRLSLVWPLALAAAWAASWAVTTAGGIQVDQQFTVFGSSGALVVTALTSVLPILISRSHVSRSHVSRNEGTAR